MQVVKTRFDEIDHIHRIEANRALPRRTMFSFMENCQYTPYVTAPGFPRLESGMQVAAVLREEGNWKSLVGWRNLQTGELAVPDPLWHVRRALFLLAWVAIAAVVGWPRESSGLGSYLVPIIASAVAAPFAVLELVQWLRVKRDADAVKVLVALEHAA